ncbi:MAG: EpsI family protein [Deltaproteobacteria bacterium]|nr:EpsI family protein [Deltaproteobacteria bacterium]
MFHKPFSTSLVILLVTISSVAGVGLRGEPEVVKTSLELLPMNIGNFQGRDDSLPAAVNGALNADKQIYRHYRSDRGEQVDLYIGYYGTAKGGRTGHNPFGCLPGSGWGIIDSYPVRLTPKRYNNGVDVNYVLARRGDAYFSALFWYQSAGDKVLATGIEQNIQRFVDRLMKNRNDGAFVRVSVVSAEEQIYEAKSLGMAFASETLDLLPDYWPVEE